MPVYKTLTVQTLNDVIRARMEVREAGRCMGLNTKDQALISLATSSLTQALLARGVDERGSTITIERLNGEKNEGLRVVCTFKDSNDGEPVADLTQGVRWMVDDLNICDPVSGQVEVALIKWAT